VTGLNEEEEEEENECGVEVKDKEKVHEKTVLPNLNFDSDDVKFPRHHLQDYFVQGTML
jgi:hypothetical protein